MKAHTVDRLLALNREFYTAFGAPFSATRGRVQPGVRRLLGSLSGEERVLDLGCGNGSLARALARRGHRGTYLGLDASRTLLAEATGLPEGFPATFLEADLTSDWLEVIAGSRVAATPRHHGVWRRAGEQSQTESEAEAATPSRLGQTPSRRSSQAPMALHEGGQPSVARHDTFEIVCCFATLHHIPGRANRSRIVRAVRTLLAPGGRFFQAHWQFLNSARLRARVQPWELIGLEAADVDPGDYLLDWRSGGSGLRYVHHFDEAELAELAATSGFRIKESFPSDGQEGNLALYQVWVPQDGRPGKL